MAYPSNNPAALLLTLFCLLGSREPWLQLAIETASPHYYHYGVVQSLLASGDDR